MFARLCPHRHLSRPFVFLCFKRWVAWGGPRSRTILQYRALEALQQLVTPWAALVPGWREATNVVVQTMRERRGDRALQRKGCELLQSPGLRLNPVAG